MILVLTTTDKKTVAQKIGNTLLRQKLVACVSILPMDSSYWWFTPSKSQRESSTNSTVKVNAKIRVGKGKIVNAKEFQVILKTKPENFEKVEKVIKKLHTYDLPEIISINIEKAGKDYLTWIDREIR